MLQNRRSAGSSGLGDGATAAVPGVGILVVVVLRLVVLVVWPVVAVVVERCSSVSSTEESLGE